jgi:uncharacterized protein (TIGR00369 family)
VTTTRALIAAAPHGGTASEWIHWAEAHPVAELIGLQVTHAEPGHVRLVVQESQWPLNPNGAVHGGMVLAWADHCFGIVAMTTAAPGVIPATATLTAEFVRPAIPPLTYDARVDRSGKTLMFISVEVLNAHGKLCAKVNGTMSADGASRFLPST